MLKSRCFVRFHLWLDAFICRHDLLPCFRYKSWVEGFQSGRRSGMEMAKIIKEELSK